MPQQEARLTTKQKRVLDLLEGGATVPEVAKQMRISEAGVYSHMRNIRKAGGTLPAERFESNGHAADANSNGNGGRADGEASGFLGAFRQQLEDELASLDAQRGQLVAALRALA